MLEILQNILYGWKRKHLKIVSLSNDLLTNVTHKGKRLGAKVRRVPFYGQENIEYFYALYSEEENDSFIYSFSSRIVNDLHCFYKSSNSTIYNSTN